MTKRASARGAILGSVFCALTGAGAATGQTPPNTLTDAERAAGWRLLFDSLLRGYA